MPKLKILSKSEIKRFNTPPELSGEERKKFFYIPSWVQKIIDTFRTSPNKVGFILQYGYFQATGQFYLSKEFHQRDSTFVAGNMNLENEKINLAQYKDRTMLRHQEIILENLGFKKFNDEAKNILEKEAEALCSNQVRPRQILLSLVDFLRSKKIEIPGYNALANIITDTLRDFEAKLIELVEAKLSDFEKEILDSLLDQKKNKSDLKIQRYILTLLKKSHQSTRPRKIKENVQDLLYLKSLFLKLESITSTMNFSPELIQYFAQTVIKSQVFQISRRDDKQYLFLISFVIHQYFRLNDTLAETLLQTVQSAFNTTTRVHKEEFYQNRQARNKVIKNISRNMKNHVQTLQDIESIIRDEKLMDSSKVLAVKGLLNQEKPINFEETKGQIQLLEKEANRVVKDTDFFDLLEKKSIKLQNRVSEILKSLEFEIESSNDLLIEAINYYKVKNGNIDTDCPVEFLSTEEQQMVYDEKNKLRVSLYKVLLFEKVADGLKSGALNLIHSFKFRSFENYLISPEIWNNRKDVLLERAGLTEFKNVDHVEKEFREALDSQFHTTNQNILSGKNKYAKIDGYGHLKVKTPKVDKESTSSLLEIFPQSRFVPLFEVFSTVNKITKFSDCLEHHQVKHVRKRPNNNTFFAGLTGYGCNLGIRKIAKISRSIIQSELEHAVNWYFNAENLNRANDRILEFLEKLSLPLIYRRKENEIHTSSDGQKFNIGVESLNANFSFKYFGKGKGVTIYTFIDESHRLFYSVVISSSEKEAAYVIDGLMHNEVVQSDIHSTDTAGYSELIFATCHLIGVSFAPRIKNFQKQQLYSLENPATYRNLEYPILPKGKINIGLIRENWDDILRFITTIKLKETTASQLFKRLSSYSKQHPLYKALKEFGKMIKTIFILKYIDDLGLRQAIEKQLNKLESSNKFGKAVYYGNNQEFQQATKDEQLIADASKRLIENAIICWNYLYLSQLIHDTKSQEQRENLIKSIQNGSVVTWQHVNMHGEFDFSDDYLKNALHFRVPEILELKVS